MYTLIEIIFLLVLLIIGIGNFIFYEVAKSLKNISGPQELSGFEVAKKISSEFLKNDCHIIKKKGKYNDHYNGNRNVIKLSPEVFDGTDLYAGSIAIHVALEANPEKPKVSRGNIFASFLVISSYIMIILGAFLGNTNVIHFGFILFILAFILILVIVEISGSEEEYKQIYEFIKKEKLLEPSDEEVLEQFTILAIMPIARLPYRFFNYFF